jgi:hypothetical protein
VLNHVEAGRILEQPARKDLAPSQRLIGRSAFFDEDLHESASLSRTFPRQRAFARGKLDQHIADPLGLTNLEHNVLALVVALVEQAQRGDAVLDRGAVFTFDHLARDTGAGQVLGHFGSRGVGFFAALAGRQRQQRGQQRDAAAHRSQPSGDQAS